MKPLISVAWAVLVVCFAGFIAALRVGESCATSVGPFLAAGMFAAWIVLSIHYERDHR